MGILAENGNGSVKETMRGRIVIPFIAFNQLPVGVYGRSVKDELLPHHRLLRGPRVGLINPNAARGHQELILVESPYDAFSLSEMGLHNAVPLCGAVLLPDHLELVRRFAVKSVVVGLDADDTGKKAGPVVAAALSELGVLARVVEWPEKDPNALLVAHGPKKAREIVDALLRAPVSCDLSAPASASVPVSHEDEAPRPTVDGVSISVSSLIDEASSREPARLPGDLGAASVREESSQAELELGAFASDSQGAPPADPTNISAEALVASPVAVSVAPAADVPAPPRPAKSELLAPGLTLSYDDRLWAVIWQDGPEGQLRAHVKVFLGAAEVPAFLDSLNLRSSRSRDGFTRKAASLALPLDASQRDVQQLLRLLEEDLLRIAELGEERRKAAVTKSDERPGTLTEERRLRAMAYAKAPHFLARVVDDIGAAGYVGEPTIKALAYLVSISRKLPEALSMVILSSSGSGKSALAEVLEKLTPEEDLIVVTRFTASSLYWMPRDALKRKFVSIEERSGSQEADYSIRALQSKSKVTMMAPIKDQATGKLETKFFEVEGPASFLESTTESRIHHENSTRCFEVRLDESCEQTRRIQDAQRFAKTLEGHRAKGRGQEIAALHQDVQRLLRPVRVVIPFAAAIEFPAESIRTRRDNPRFLNLIEALAFLHQVQRPLTLFESGEKAARTLEELSDDELDGFRVEATLDDYAMAYELAAELLYETLAELKRPLRAFFSAVRELAREEGTKRGVKASCVPLLTRQIRDRTRLEQHTVRRYLAELVELEYLAITRGVNGAAYAYRLVDLPEKEGGRIPGLLLPEELAAKLERLRSEAAEERPS